MTGITKFEPRQFQLRAAREIWRAMFIEGHQCVLLVAPTGAGKTVIGSFFMVKVIELLKWIILFMAGRREIIKQTSTKLYQGGLWPGTIMAGEQHAMGRDVQVASIQTYLSWRNRGKIQMRKPSLVVIDEAHGIGAPQLDALIDEMVDDDIYVLGMTATPIGTAGYGLGKRFTKMIQTPGFKWLAEHDPPYLVLPRYFVGIIPDLKGVRIIGKNREFDERQVNAVIDSKMLVGNVIDQYFKHSPFRPTILFANSVPHSMHLEQAFRNANSELRVQHIDGETHHTLRDDSNANLKLGRLDMILNYGTHVEGTDIPNVSCIIDAAPTNSLSRYLQRGGRGSRVDEGKTDFNYHDHSGNRMRHGALELVRNWLLCEGQENLAMNEQAIADAKKEHVCPECGALHTGKFCPVCNAEYVRQGEEMAFIESELYEMTNGEFLDAVELKKHKLNAEQQSAEQGDFLAQALGWCLEHGKKPAMALYACEAKFKGKKLPPNWQRMQPTRPTPEVEKYMKHRMIRAAKGFAKMREEQRG